MHSLGTLGLCNVLICKNSIRNLWTVKKNTFSSTEPVVRLAAWCCQCHHLWHHRLSAISFCDDLQSNMRSGDGWDCVGVSNKVFLVPPAAQSALLIARIILVQKGTVTMLYFLRRYNFAVGAVHILLKWSP